MILGWSSDILVKGGITLMDKLYCGVIVEEALDDNILINNLIIEKVHITDHENRHDRWHMYQVKICSLVQW